MAGVTLQSLATKIDAVAATTNAKIDAVAAATNERIDAVAVATHARIDATNARIDGLAASTEKQFNDIMHTFGEMREFVADGVGRLGRDVNERFDKVERRLERIDDKLDRALAHRLRVRGRRR